MKKHSNKQWVSAFVPICLRRKQPIILATVWGIWGFSLAPLWITTQFLVLEDSFGDNGVWLRVYFSHYLVISLTLPSYTHILEDTLTIFSFHSNPQMALSSIYTHMYIVYFLMAMEIMFFLFYMWEICWHIHVCESFWPCIYM